MAHLKTSWQRSFDQKYADFSPKKEDYIRLVAAWYASGSLWINFRFGLDIITSYNYISIRVGTESVWKFLGRRPMKEVSVTEFPNILNRERLCKKIPMVCPPLPG
jgi:hypothetical protein